MNLKNNHSLSLKDYYYLNQTLKLAKKAKFSAHPNPMVGAILVLNDKIIAKGYHQKYGSNHAEINALNQAFKKGYKTKDLNKATLYISLEPCNHQGKTPACTKAIIDSGIKKVVIASLDANPKMQAKSLQLLAKNGVECLYLENLFAKQAKKLNKAHIKRYQLNFPYIRLKIASNLYGNLYQSNQQKLIITHQKKSRLDVQKLRAKVDAIITGINTVLVDNPKLTIYDPKIIKKYPDIRQSIRVILDTNLKIISNKYSDLNILVDNQSQVIIYHHQQNFKKSDKFAKNISFRFVQVDNNSNLDLKAIALDLIDQDNVCDILFEAGYQLASEVIKQKLADEWVFYLANKNFSSKDSICDFFRQNVDDYQLVKTKYFKKDLKMIYQKKQFN